MSAQGVADGTGAQIKATVTGRTISAVVRADAVDLAGLPGVVSVDQQGPRYQLRCNDSDTALRALLAGYDDVRDIEISAGNLEEAFLELTGAAHHQQSTERAS